MGAEYGKYPQRYRPSFLLSKHCRSLAGYYGLAKRKVLELAEVHREIAEQLTPHMLTANWARVSVWEPSQPPGKLPMKDEGPGIVKCLTFVVPTPFSSRLVARACFRRRTRGIGQAAISGGGDNNNDVQRLCGYDAGGLLQLYPS